MLAKKYNYIVYFIALTIVATIIAQVYWNVKNYEVNKQQISNQIQSSFDDSVEKYYADIAKNNVYKIIKYDGLLSTKETTQPAFEHFTPLILKRKKNGIGFDTLRSPSNIISLKNNETTLTTKTISNFIKNKHTQVSKFSDSIDIEVSAHNFTTDVWIQDIGDSIPKRPKNNLLQPTFGHSNHIILKETSPLDSFQIPTIKHYRTQRLKSSDSIEIEYLRLSNPKKNISFGKALDSLEMQRITSEVILSFQNDILDLEKLDSLFSSELKRKNIRLNYGLKYETKDMFSEVLTTVEHKLTNFPEKHTSTISNSTFLPKGSKLVLLYTDTSLEIFKRTLGSILLSLLLSLLIIGCLLFLLNIIFKQKQLAEIKNDLISNITHEFKTPLATISVALEGIQRFNNNNDPEKSKKYAEMSKTEVEKLTLMVEKLLETATLGSDNLQLNLEETNLVSLVEKVSTINPELTNGKEITFTSNKEKCLVNIDRFHFENALNNIIDNAIKYGGTKIEINLKTSNSEAIITIKDYGKELNKQQASKIFEKFYRVPKGNTHDVKGFGIGLYYSENIIKKHGGTIGVDVGNGTEFKIVIPK